MLLSRIRIGAAALAAITPLVVSTPASAIFESTFPQALSVQESSGKSILVACVGVLTGFFHAGVDEETRSQHPEEVQRSEAAMTTLTEAAHQRLLSEGLSPEEAERLFSAFTGTYRTELTAYLELPVEQQNDADLRAIYLFSLPICAELADYLARPAEGGP
ncbi:MAG: hypothetical protein IT535_15610 [Bauldia sp.]|nr:hypothetical protein [Bauldia sp.]